MEELRLRAGREELKVKGSPEVLQREREAFYQHMKEIEEVNAKAKAEIVQKMREDIAWSARWRQEKEAEKAIVTRACGELQGSWEYLAKAIKDGVEFKVGDYKRDKTTDGQAFTMVVTDVTDEYVRFESRDCIGDYTRWSESRNTKCGLASSDVMKYLNEKIWNVLPDDMQRVIDPVVRKHKDSEGEVKKYRLALFLPAASEVFDEDDCYGDQRLYEQLEYYKNRRNRMRGSSEGEDAESYWLASVGSGNSAHACLVGDGGNAYYWNASNALRVPVCFCIKKS